jgi:hypothetical protein
MPVLKTSSGVAAIHDSITGFSPIIAPVVWEVNEKSVCPHGRSEYYSTMQTCIHILILTCGDVGKHANITELLPFLSIFH